MSLREIDTSGEPVNARSVAAAPSKFSRFRRLLTAPQLSFLMEAHNGISAKIVEEAGFEGIWASGLTLSASLGVRDRNEASWTQVLDVLEFMADGTSIPIMLDGDTGYGDFNNFRRLVRKLCQREIAAVCIEDKLFPKTNSFIGSERQQLAPLDEFCGKIKAGKDSQPQGDFSIVARVEALIAGWGLDEALRRAEAYHEAGADGILIHSRKASADEILRFAEAWGNRAPVVIVPTKYYATPTEKYRAARISMVIWANHNLRAAINAMRETSERIFREQSLLETEGRVASVDQIFELAGETEMETAEQRYLPGAAEEARAILLAASRGSALGALTAEVPKCMLDIRGEPLLRRLARALNTCGIKDISVIVGYKPEAVDLLNVRKHVNERYDSTGEVASLAVAEAMLEGRCLISYGDILCREYIIDLALQAPADVAVVVDGARPRRDDASVKGTGDLVRCSKPYTGNYLEDEGAVLEHCLVDGEDGAVHGEWIGLAALSDAGAELVRAEIAAMRQEGVLERADMPELFNRLIARGIKPQVIYTAGNWLDVNDAFDLAQARNFA